MSTTHLKSRLHGGMLLAYVYRRSRRDEVPSVSSVYVSKYFLLTDRYIRVLLIVWRLSDSGLELALPRAASRRPTFLSVRSHAHDELPIPQFMTVHLAYSTTEYH